MDKEERGWSDAIDRVRLKDLSEQAMNASGFIVVEEDGFIVKKFKDGRKEIIEKLGKLSKNLKFD